jgi:flagellar protein FliJ
VNRFRFRLESVLRVREIEEDIKKREFGVVMRRLHREEQELGKLSTSLQDHEQYMESHTEGRVCVRDLQNNFNYARALDGKILFQKKRVKEKKKIVDHKRSELAESTKRKRILERLKERYREEHEREVVKEEQSIVDDITSVRYNWSE